MSCQNFKRFKTIFDDLINQVIITKNGYTDLQNEYQI